MNNETNKDIICEEVDCALCGSSLSTPIAYGYDYEYWTSEQMFFFVKCDFCGHLYLNPRPGPGSFSSIYPPNYYTLEGRHTAKTSILISSLKKVIVRKRLAYFHDLFSRGIKILEIGCGDCSLLIDLNDTVPGAELTGLDITFTDEIREKCSNERIHLIESSIEDAPLKANEYDIVIMNQLIEHLWKPAEVLRKINDSLVSGGFISIETVNIEGYDRGIFSKGFWGGYYFPRHFNLFSFESLKNLLENTGFRVVKQYSLLASIIWTFSFHAYFCPSESHKGTIADRFFSDRNPLALSIFTIVDMIALLFGLKTSNQKTIAQKSTAIRVDSGEIT